jgi:hypothetical protein
MFASYNSHNANAVNAQLLGSSAAAGGHGCGASGSSSSGSSSYKGVQYLMAERKWQAYVVDHALTEVGQTGPAFV